MKNPFARDESSTIITVLLGVIVLVFVALGLSLLLDQNIKLPNFSASSARLRDHNDSLRRQINNMEVRMAAQATQQQTAEDNNKELELLVDMKKQLSSANDEIKILHSLIKKAQESIQIISKGRETHRLLYRDHVRASASGEQYESIQNILGKEYKNVRINEVTPLGVSISHSTGASRLDFREMPAEWRVKFMFTANEVAEATAKEDRRLSKTRQELARREKASQKVRQTESRRREIASIRSKIASLSIKYSSANLEASLARNKVATQNSLKLSRSFARSNYGYRSYNSSTGTYSSYYRPRYRITVNARQSVPGSLETWEQRAVRYQRAAASYSAQLANLKSRLAVLVPSSAGIPPAHN